MILLGSTKVDIPERKDPSIIAVVGSFRAAVSKSVAEVLLLATNFPCSTKSVTHPIVIALLWISAKLT